MTHLYTLLVGGTVIPGGDKPDASAIAWAADTVIAIGGDEEIRAISRGDSHLIDLRGAIVVPLAAAGKDADATWPADATLEVGGRADLAVLNSDPRRAHARAHARPATDSTPRALALVRGGRIVKGALPGASAHGDHDHAHG